MAEGTIRARRMKRLHKPAMTRSAVRRLGPCQSDHCDDQMKNKNGDIAHPANRISTSRAARIQVNLIMPSTPSLDRCLVGEICGSPIRSNGGREFGSRSPRTDADSAALTLCCSQPVAFRTCLRSPVNATPSGGSTRRESRSRNPGSVIEPRAVKPHPSTYCCGILSGRRLRY